MVSRKEDTTRRDTTISMEQFNEFTKKVLTVGKAKDKHSQNTTHFWFYSFYLKCIFGRISTGYEPKPLLRAQVGTV